MTPHARAKVRKGTPNFQQLPPAKPAPRRDKSDPMSKLRFRVGAQALPEELVLEAVNTWCSLSAMNMNPEKTMIQFAMPEA